MGLFSRKNAEQQNASVAAAPQEPHCGQVDTVDMTAWIRDLRKADAQKLFKEVYLALESVTSMLPPEEDKTYAFHRDAHESSLMAGFQEIQSEWMSVEREQLNAEDAALLYDTVVTFLPRVAVFYRNPAARNGVWDAVSKTPIANGFPVAKVLKQRYVDLVAVRSNQWSDSYAKSLPKSFLDIPSFSSDDVELQNALEQLHTLWVAADTQDLGVADRFFVEEVAARYFPDAWRMFQSFAGGEEAVVLQARAVLLEQISLMVGRLQRLSSESHLASLEGMKVHSSFLREVSA